MHTSGASDYILFMYADGSVFAVANGTVRWC